MIITIVGPTGVGKSDLSLFLAHKLNADIMNADSTQIYKGMNIVTGKIKDTEGITHYLFDELDPKEDYSVYDFQKEGRKILEDHIKTNKNIIIVGGTGLYIKALLYDYKFEKKDNTTYDELSNEEIYNKLKELDPDINIHINNRKRLINALNYITKNNKPYSKKQKTNKLLYNTIFIGLTTDRQTLYKRIDKRVDEMVKEGLIEEAKYYYDKNIRTKAVLTPIGYKELFNYFDKKITLEEAIDQMKKNSRHYAKRQYTWFNNQMEIKWFKTNYNNFNLTEEEVLDYIKNKSIINVPGDKK